MTLHIERHCCPFQESVAIEPFTCFSIYSSMAGNLRESNMDTFDTGKSEKYFENVAK